MSERLLSRPNSLSSIAVQLSRHDLGLLFSVRFSFVPLARTSAFTWCPRRRPRLTKPDSTRQTNFRPLKKHRTYQRPQNPRSYSGPGNVVSVVTCGLAQASPPRLHKPLQTPTAPSLLHSTPPTNNFLSPASATNILQPMAPHPPFHVFL